MEKEDVMRIRKELHHLAPADRDKTDRDGNRTINIPLIIRVNTSYLIDEMTCCVIWDDDNEILYSVEYNNASDDPLRNICPMTVKAYPYSSIELIQARLDRLTLDNFFNQMVGRGLTSNEVRERYNKQVADIYDPETYMMGAPSPTTEKRDLRPDDVVINKESYKTL